MATKIVGILNVTPDSISDGGSYFECEAALNRAKEMVQDGAEIIDIGGDSSRPGSECVGSEREWIRIGSLVEKISKFCTVSVDTHLASTAKLALEAGASIINDISGGADPRMWSVVKSYDAHFVIMHSLCSQPHKYDAKYDIDVVHSAKDFWTRKKAEALEFGFNPDQLILDPGMGAFLGPDPQSSWSMLDALPKIFKEVPLFVGVSRKGFLKKVNEDSIEDRDAETARIGRLLASQIDTLYLRVHNVSRQRGEL